MLAPSLAWTIYLAFGGAAVLALMPKGRGVVADSITRWFALLVAVATLVVAAWGFFTHVGSGREILVDVPWIPSMGIHYLLAADGISRMLVLLTGLAAVAGILFSWNIEKRTNEFFAFYLALIGGVFGVFLSYDLFLLFVFYEIAIVPKYFLIAIWGSTRKEYAAMKLALYSFVGSAMVLIGALAAYAISGGQSMSLIALSHANCRCTFRCGLSAGVCGVWNFGRLVAISYMGSDGPRGCTNGGEYVVGRRGDEAGRVWVLARGDWIVSAWSGPMGIFVCGDWIVA